MSAVATSDRLTGKVALVTGAARGLGRAYALRLAALGADVAVVDIDLDAAREFGEALKAESVAAEIERMSRRSLGIQGDLTRGDDARRAIRVTYEAFGRLDILVNNAGVSAPPALLTRMSSRPNAMKAQRSGVIVNISSQSAISTYQQG